MASGSLHGFFGDQAKSGSRLFLRRHALDEKQMRSLVEVSLFFLAGTLCIFGPLRDNSRMAWYALIVLKGPVCWALKRLFPALMTGNTDV